VGSGRVSTWVGLAAVLALLTAAPAVAQPERRVKGLTDPFAATVAPDAPEMPARQLVPPRTAYQAPQPDRREPDFTLPPGAAIPVPQSKTRKFTYGPRYGPFPSVVGIDLSDGTTRFLITGGVVINVEALDGSERTEFATDEAVVWVRNSGGKGLLNGLVTGDGKTKIEVYMAGNVLIRATRGTKNKPITQTLRAAEVYYDTDENRAVALRADLEMSIPNSPDAFHLRGEEVRRLDLENWEILRASANASKLPSDPGLRLDATRYTLSERRVVRRNIFGIPFRDFTTGEEVEINEQIVNGQNVVTRLAGVPVFYAPRLRLNAEDPLGPLTGLGFSINRQFGPQFYTTWDMYELLALRPPPGHTWRLHLDYLGKRGPAAGTDYVYKIPGETPADLPIGAGLVKLYGIDDRGFDLLGGYRGIQPMPPELRGRALWRHQQEVTEELYFQGQVSLLSDKNFLEQYWKNEFDMGPSQESFAYLDWKRRNFGATAMVQDRLNQQWQSQTNWLPRLDGHLIGQTFLDDLFVYSARGSAAYAQSRPSEYIPYPLLSTDRRVDTGRFDAWQELSAPLALGPVKFAPYGILDLTEYTSDLNGNEVGRVYGAGGARASLPLSRLYDDVSSELLNVRGLYHKAVLGANYRYARTNVPYTQLPLLDRLNDDATDQSWRYITPFQPLFVPGAAGQLLANGPGYSPFNPQLYAIRRVVENRTDTLDNVNVLQMDLRQRLQTKRGYPGMEHTVDFLTFDVSGSYFPDAARDNFGHPFAFLEYAGVWNVGDRTALTSSGWFEPYANGSRYWDAGLYLNRTDRTNLYFGYRQTDPINSKAVTASASYRLSPRYFVTASTSYDFGIQQALANTLVLTRTGTDLTVSFGVSYNAFVNSFGFQFFVLPNIATVLGGKYANALGGVNSQALGQRR
jgi:hypothetical protein